MLEGIAANPPKQSIYRKFPPSPLLSMFLFTTVTQSAGTLLQLICQEKVHKLVSLRKRNSGYQERKKGKKEKENKEHHMNINQLVFGYLQYFTHISTFDQENKIKDTTKCQ